VLSRSRLAESFVGVQLPSLFTDDDDDDDDLVGVDLPWRVYLQFNYGFNSGEPRVSCVGERRNAHGNKSMLAV